uniref:Alternative protein OTUD4 n=1 Tax=Homo sapiens TaxID=9606 RepID=L8EAV3_HUMAN|nr:alternative protein OTUD4 [Homo sapiens]
MKLHHIMIIHILKNRLTKAHLFFVLGALAELDSSPLFPLVLCMSLHFLSNLQLLPHVSLAAGCWHLCSPHTVY